MSVMAMLRQQFDPTFRDGSSGGRALVLGATLHGNAKRRSCYVPPLLVSVRRQVQQLPAAMSAATMRSATATVGRATARCCGVGGTIRRATTRCCGMGGTMG